MDATSHNLGLAEVSRHMSYACLGWSFLSPSEVYIAFPLLILLSTLPHSSLFLSPYPQKANDPPSLRYPRNVFLSIGLPQATIELNFRMGWVIQMMGIFKTTKVNMIKTKKNLSLYSEVLIQFLKIINAIRIDLENTLFAFITFFFLNKKNSWLFVASQPTERKEDGLV